MKKPSLVGGACGLVLGVICALGAIAVSSIVAFTDNRHVSLPGIFSVWTDDTDGTRGPLFDPSTGGLLLVLVAASVLGVVCARHLGHASHQ